MLEKYGLASANQVPTLEDSTVKLKRDDGVSKYLSEPTQYQSMVGALFSTAMATRPEIVHAVGVPEKQQTQSSSYYCS